MDKKHQVRDAQASMVRRYHHVLYGQLSDDDLMAVVLKVGDWKAIAENLRDDADAESLGPAVSQFMEEVPEGTLDSGDGYAKAYAHDAERCYAHQCRAATERVADTIQGTLEDCGWDL